MSATDSTDCNRLKQATANMVAHPTLSVKDAMKLADFSVDEREDKTIRQKVLRGLPGKGKCRMKELTSKGGEVGSVVAFVDIEEEKIVMYLHSPATARQVCWGVLACESQSLDG